ncbi:MAG: CAAX prenyl protease-related protein, partial [Bryobacteraceae bacterium]
VDGPFRVAALTAALWFFSRRAIRLKARFLLPSALAGVAVFLVWVAPDAIFPHYRDHWLLQNAVTGTLHFSIPPRMLSNPWVLAFRTIRAVALVPVVEELFWRGWLMRWLISQDFERVPLGSYAPLSFWVTAILFACEHGPYWDVGLVAGIVYNWWCLRTRSLGDCILAHAVTNAALAGYVIATHRWEYWL